MKNKKNKKAFSLIELMIVVVILGFLIALVAPNILGQGEEAKQKVVCIQMQNLKKALDAFKFDNGVYPTTEEGLEALLKNPDAEKYKNYNDRKYLSGDKLPRDSWQNRYHYINDNGKVEIISLGADGREGGEDSSKDLTLSECR